MKKRLKRFIALLAVSLVSLLSLSSCMLVEAGLVFSNDCETVTVYEETAFEKSELEKNDMTPEEYYKALDENNANSYVGWEHEDSEITKDGKTYINRRYYKVCTYEEALSNELSNRIIYKTDFNIEKTSKELNVSVKYTYNGEVTDEEKLGDSEDISYIFRIEAPFELIETNGTTEQEFDKKIKGSKTVITWDYTDIVAGHEEEKDITVSFKLPDSRLSVLVACGIIGAVVIISVAVVIIVLKKKEKTPSLPDDIIPTAEAIPEVKPEPSPESVTAETPEPITEKIPEEKAEEPTPAEEEKTDEITEKAEIKFCPYCGVKYEPNGAFCVNCGEPKTK